MKKLHAMLALITVGFFSHAQTYLAVQDFSTATGTTPPAGWTNVSNNGYANTVWKFLTTTPGSFFAPLTGANVAFPYAAIGKEVGYATPINTSLASPAFSTIGSTYATLEFAGYYTYNYSDTVIIEYSLNGGSSWATVKKIENNIGENYQRGLCSYVVIPLPAAAQNKPSVKIRFSVAQHASGGNWYMAIDNVKVINRPPATILPAAGGGNWGDTATWAGGRVPAYFDDVIIPDGALVLNDISPNIKNLTVGNGVSGYLIFNGGEYQQLTVTGNLLTNPGSTFNPVYNNSEGRRVDVKGNVTLNGTSDFSLMSTRLTLSGSTPQTISGTGNLGGSISPIRNIEMTNPAGVTISRLLTITERADIACNVTNGSNLIFDNISGTGLDSVSLYIKGNSNFSAPVVVGATAKYCVNYYSNDTTPTAKIAGNEIPVNNTLYRLYMYNDAGLTVNKDLTLTSPWALDLAVGTITIGASNSITCTNSAFNGAEGYYSTAFVQGGDLILTCSGTSTKTFPVGSDGRKATFTFNNLQASGQVAVRLLKSGAGAPGTGLSGLSASRRWYSRLVTGTYSGYSGVTIEMNDNDNFGSSPTANYRVGFQTSLVSNYSSVGQAQLVNNTYITSATAQTLFGYHALGLSAGNLPLVWTGSANTNNWGDAFNWRNNQLPTNSDEVILDGNITINLASGPGNYFAKTLLVRTGTTLNSTLQNTLTVGAATGKKSYFYMYGNLNMSSGTINVNGNMQCARGDYGKMTFQMSGGNIIIDGNDGGNSATSVSASDLMLLLQDNFLADGSTINGTGGTITIVDPNANSGSTVESVGLYVSAYNTGLFTVAGTTFRFGDGISTDACQEQGFVVESSFSNKNIPLGNVIVNSRTDGNANRYLGVTSNYNTITDIAGNLTVMPNAEVRTNATNHPSDTSTIRVGGNIVNNGAIRIYGLNGGRLLLGSSPVDGTPETTTPQTISGTGSWSNSQYIINNKISSLAVNNRGGVTLNVPLNVVQNLGLKKGAITTTDANLITHGDYFYYFPGTISVDSGYINGPLKRLIPNNTFSDSTGLFPVGTNNFSRPVKINYTAAPNGAGSLTARFISTAGGNNGLPLNDAGTQINVVSQQGYWELTESDGLAGGTYNAEVTGNGFSGITTPAELRIVKRANAAAPWALQGTHTAGSGVTAKRTGLTGFSQFAIAANSLNNSLPVTLISLKGYRQGNSNNVSWTTTTEINNAGFELQRSADGISFTKVAFINSVAINGNSTDALHYQYNDTKGFAGNTYYRLQQIDKDSKTVLSNTILIKGLLGNNFEIIGIYPNPALNIIHLSIAVAANEKATIEIMDMSGKKVVQQLSTLTIGDNTIALNISRLSAGKYVLKFISENGTSSTKTFVKE